MHKKKPKKKPWVQEEIAHFVFGKYFPHLLFLLPQLSKVIEVSRRGERKYLVQKVCSGKFIQINTF